MSRPGMNHIRRHRPARTRPQSSDRDLAQPAGAGPGRRRGGLGPAGRPVRAAGATTGAGAGTCRSRTSPTSSRRSSRRCRAHRRLPQGPGRRHVPRLAPDDHAEQGPRPLPPAGPGAGRRGRDRGPAPVRRAPRRRSPTRTTSERGQAERGLFRRALELIRGEFEERTWQAFWRTAVDGRAPRPSPPNLGMSPGPSASAKSRVLRRFREELGEL